MIKIKILKIYATIGIFAFVIALLVVWLALPLGTTDKVGITMAISTVALIIVTSVYAWHTQKMAEEMREQRYAESLPLLVPTIPPILSNEKLPYEALQGGFGLKVKWFNKGKGVAINSRFFLWGAPLPSEKVRFFQSRESIALGVGDEKETDYGNYEYTVHDVPGTYQPRLEAEYQDIYERKITTVQEFRIEDKSDYKEVLLGDLYFTVNGRRLGQEVAQHD